MPSKNPSTTTRKKHARNAAGPTPNPWLSEARRRLARRPKGDKKRGPRVKAHIPPLKLQLIARDPIDALGKLDWHARCPRNLSSFCAGWGRYIDAVTQWREPGKSTRRTAPHLRFHRDPPLCSTSFAYHILPWAYPEILRNFNYQTRPRLGAVFVIACQ